MYFVELMAALIGFRAVLAVPVNGLLQPFLSDVNALAAVAFMVGRGRQTRSGHRQRRSYQCHKQNIFALSNSLRHFILRNKRIGHNA
jgi:hypothetical protein